jgi:hypothetical protein
MPIDAVVSQVELSIGKPLEIGRMALIENCSWLLEPVYIVQMASPELRRVRYCLFMMIEVGGRETKPIIDTT